eukprot:6488065-Amphidinium_carterae.2
MHEVQDGIQFIETLGMELDGLAKMASSSSTKRWRLKKAWEFLRRFPVLSGAQLEILLGHLTHIMLLNRCTLAVFDQSYVFIRRYYSRRRTLWASVYRELRMAFGLIPLMSVWWDQPWCSLVNSSDASGVGYAVHEGHVPIAD